MGEFFICLFFYLMWLPYYKIARQYIDFNQFVKAQSNPLVYFFMADKRRWPVHNVFVIQANL